MSVLKWVAAAMVLAAPVSAAPVTFEFNSGTFFGVSDSASDTLRPVVRTLTVDQAFLPTSLAGASLSVSFGPSLTDTIRYSLESGGQVFDGSVNAQPAATARSFRSSAPSLPPFVASYLAESWTSVQMNLDEHGQVTSFEWVHAGDCVSFTLRSDAPSDLKCWIGDQRWRASGPASVAITSGQIQGALPDVSLPAGAVLLLSGLAAGALMRRRARTA